MRLGAFIIHGDNRETLGACLDDLLAVGDEVVAVDSGSTDGSADVVRARGVRRVELPWQGYGAARAAARDALAGCDWLFFLDADERFAEGSAEAIRAWKRSSPRGRAHWVERRDWAVLNGCRFLYRRQRRKRLLRADAAAWRPSMIVHEAIEGPAERLDAPIDHLFATTLEHREWKNQRYALLWAVQAHVEGRRAKPAWATRGASALKDALFQGAMFRGGVDGLRLAWQVSGYHAQKQHYLRRVRAGEFPELVAEYAGADYRAVFELLDRVLPRARPSTPGDQ
jgi:(heptosyl)LPS beta-1,4-glucosyltransferase